MSVVRCRRRRQREEDSCRGSGGVRNILFAHPSVEIVFAVEFGRCFRSSFAVRCPWPFASSLSVVVRLGCPPFSQNVHGRLQRGGIPPLRAEIGLRDVDAVLVAQR